MEKSYLKTESYLSEIKEAIYSKNREQTDLLIKKLRHQMSDSDSQELRLTTSVYGKTGWP